MTETEEKEFHRRGIVCLTKELESPKLLKAIYHIAQQGYWLQIGYHPSQGGGKRKEQSNG